MAYKRILLRRDTASNWTSNNPTLAAGEFGYESNTGKYKIGNGSTAWTSLAYSIITNLNASTLNDLGDVTITSAADGDFLRWNGTAWINDAVNLSTDTVGSYVASLVAGTGVTLSNNSGEGATPTIAIGQAVATDSNVTFNDLIVSGNLTVSGTTTTLNTTEILLEDNIITLNSGEIGTPSANAGIEIERGTSTNVALRWNESTDKWETTNDGTTYGNLVTTADSGTVTSTMIADGTIANSDISTTAAIDLGKLADISTSAQTASYTLVLADKNKIVEMNVGSANTLTVPLNSSVAFPVGSQINILQTGSGQTTITATGGVTINATPGLKMRAQWSSATLIKRATDGWVLIGDLSA